MKKAIIILLAIIMLSACSAMAEEVKAPAQKQPTEEQVLSAIQLAMQRRELAIFQAKAAQEDIDKLKAMLKELYAPKKVEK